MRYSLRSLLVLLLVLPPLGAWAWREYVAYRERQAAVQIYCEIQVGGPQPEPGLEELPDSDETQ